MLSKSELLHQAKLSMKNCIAAEQAEDWTSFWENLQDVYNLLCELGYKKSD